ncbi:Uncharacterised protein [Bordetella pertussis]|nr:Uncharacterised protein [Bordetella pertussis]
MRSLRITTATSMLRGRVSLMVRHPPAGARLMEMEENLDE